MAEVIHQMIVELVQLDCIHLVQQNFMGTQFVVKAPNEVKGLTSMKVQQELSNRSVHEIPEMYAEVNTTQQDQTHICLESLVSQSQTSQPLMR